MLGNGHVPFLGGGMMVTSSCYPTGASSGGTGTLRLYSWLLLTSQEFAQRSVSPLFLLLPLSLLPDFLHFLWPLSLVRHLLPRLICRSSSSTHPALACPVVASLPPNRAA